MKDMKSTRVTISLAMVALLFSLVAGSTPQTVASGQRPLSAPWADWVEPEFPFFSSVLDAGRGTDRPVRERPADPPDLLTASVDHGCVDRITRSDRTPLAGATSLAEATPRV